jgi:hypothetical protein
MQKLLTLLASVSVMAVLTIGFSSCKDDDEDPKNATLTFSTDSKTVAEGETSVKANLVLDGPAPSDLIVEYEIDGTATRKIGSATNGDYEVVGSVGEVEIAQGETTAQIELNILTDNALEQNETIVLTIVDVSSGQVQIGDEDEMIITIEGGGSVTASMAATTLTVNEAAEGVHEITVQLATAAAFDVTVEYQLKSWLDAGGNYIPGTAIDSVSAYNEELPSEYYDYYIDGVSGELTIPAGQTSGVIKVNVLSDFIYEGDETIEITLISSAGVEVGTNNKTTITVEQENGKIVQLSWPDNTDVDMDLFIWLTLDDEGTPVTFPIAYGINASTEGPELRIIPDVFSEIIMDDFGITTVNYGASFVYYEGTVDPLEFTSFLVDYQNGDEQLISEKVGTYSLDNINPWDTNSGTDPIIEQTFDYSNGDLINISDISIPADGSRVRTARINKALKRNMAPITTRQIK